MQCMRIPQTAGRCRRSPGALPRQGPLRGDRQQQGRRQPARSAAAVAAEENPPQPHQASFILQVRSYPDPDSADARRAEIILNGLSADVVKSVENGKIWYRVVSGPYDSQEAAVAAQQTLQHSGIDSIVVKR